MVCVAAYAVLLCAAIVLSIHGSRATYIGDAGRKSSIVDIALYLAISVLCIGYGVIVVFTWRDVFSWVVCFVNAFVSLMCLTGGVITLLEVKLESKSRILTTRLVNCRVRRGSRIMRRIDLEGDSLESLENHFIFTGRDVYSVRNAVERGVIGVDVQYYELSGRVYKIASANDYRKEYENNV